MMHVLERSVPYVVVFAGALALTLFLTPIVREFNRRLGMVDKPGARRINKVPIPRGGGLALMLGVLVSYSIFALVTSRPAMSRRTDCSPFGRAMSSAPLNALVGMSA